MAVNVCNNNNNYKSCPLKKRPIIYVREELQQQHQQSLAVLALTKMPEHCVDEQPQDLSLKRKASHFHTHEDCVVPAKRDCVLNLSKTAAVPQTASQRTPVQSYDYRPESPAFASGDHFVSSAMLSPKEEELDNSLEYQPSNIHLRGLNNASAGYTTTNPYHSAFVMAAGCNPMSALWNTYQPNITGGIYPSPASSVASTGASPHYSYQQNTPPSSPGSDSSACTEPEDLSVRNDIPLPALFHLFDEAPTSLSSNQPHAALSPRSISSSYSSASFSSVGASVHAAAAAVIDAKNYRFKCEKCSKMYSTSIGLSKHQQFHCPAAECNQEKKQHACHECGKQYTTIGALKMHIRTHTLPCKCPICGKAFSRPWLLQGHIRTHTGEKPFQCPDCPRSFADRSNLRAHQQTHVQVKKYACQVCHKSFSRMSLLNKHVSSNCTITIA